MKNVLTLSVFEGLDSGHGGQHRTQQIKEIVASRFPHQHITMPIKYNSIKPVSLRNKLVHSVRIPAVWSASEMSRKTRSVAKLLIESDKYYVQQAELGFRAQDIRNASTIVWENNYPEFFYLPYVLKNEYNVKLIGAPQNIESLVPQTTSRWMGKSKVEYFKQELEPLRLCDEIFTISEEEEWLLNLFDIPAKFLPSYPEGAQYHSSLAIRKARTENATEDYFLIVGSVANPPTRLGVTALLQTLDAINADRKYRFKIAGYATETLRAEFGATPNVEILGAVEQEELNTLMKKCKAMIVSQGHSTGALTKVPEILVAGIPIIMNVGASRTYRRMDGVFVFDSPDELKKYMDTAFAMPALPPVPHEKYKRFLDAIV